MIEVKKLTKDYGHGRGIFDVDFSVNQGETLGFLGPNGAGKSTTMRHLMGFSKPHSGCAIIDGNDTWKKHSLIIKSVGYLPGEVNLPDGLKGYEFINMMKGLRGIRKNDTEADKKVKELLERFELEPSGDVKRMSIGEKRKLAVVTAFMSDPDVLLLDEPTSGLDPLMQERFIEFIREEKKKGKTILLSSHIFSEVEALCDRIAIIKDGKLISTIDAADVKHGLKNIFTIRFQNQKGMEEFLDKTSEDKLETGDIDREKAEVVLTIDNNETNKVIRLLSFFKIRSFTEHSITLEEFFMHFYKNDKKFALS
ncbi:ABC-2 type transport system ATP-binding protein [Eubacterium ruminantium]|nr:ABC-2 type transport system ATP-binding protein [Eubacterium ruminantium]